MRKIFTNHFASLSLDRYPADSHPSLQGFDAADEYLLNELSSEALSLQTRVLVINDSFGALACSLANKCIVDTYNDSHLSKLALYKNLAYNNLPISSVQFINSTEILDTHYDVVLIKIPKTLALLEEQLIQLQPCLAKTTLVLASAMVKHLPKNAIELLQKYIGIVHPSLAVKKARLLKIIPSAKPFSPSPYPTYYNYQPLRLRLANYANVFCREGLDIGTRVLIPYLTHQPAMTKVADLGCGNGILGIIFAVNNPQAELIMIDESYMAIASAKENWQQALPDRPATLKAADGLANQEKDSLDCVLCNPPFHQQQVIGDFIARRMFEQAQACLKTQGELWVVANRHLAYFQLLKKLFKQVTVITQTNKFIILKATK